MLSAATPAGTPPVAEENPPSTADAHPPTTRSTSHPKRLAGAYPRITHPSLPRPLPPGAASQIHHLRPLAPVPRSHQPGHAPLKSVQRHDAHDQRTRQHRVPVRHSLGVAAAHGLAPLHPAGVGGQEGRRHVRRAPIRRVHGGHSQRKAASAAPAHHTVLPPLTAMHGSERAASVTRRARQALCGRRQWGGRARLPPPPPTWRTCRRCKADGGSVGARRGRDGQERAREVIPRQWPLQVTHLVVPLD